MSKFNCEKICWSCHLCANLVAALSFTNCSPEVAAKAIALTPDEEWRFLYGSKILAATRDIHNSEKLAKLYAMALQSRGVDAISLANPLFESPMIRFDGDRMYKQIDMREKLFATMLVSPEKTSRQKTLDILYGTRETYYR